MLTTSCFNFLKAPPSDAPVVDTAEQVYISSLALLKVLFTCSFARNWNTVNLRHPLRRDFL